MSNVRRVGAVFVVAVLFAASCGGDDEGSNDVGAAIDVDDTTTSGPAIDPTVADDATTTVPPVAARVVEASVERVDTGTLSITWSTDSAEAPVAVSWGPDPDSPNQPLAGLEAVTSGGAMVDDPSGGGRPYFRIEAAGGGLTVAERRLPLEGAPNFRDLGGYQTADGRHVRWGRLYRAGELGELTDADQAYLVDTLGINLVCDLRSPGEVEAVPDPAFPGVERIELPVFDDSVDPVAIREAVLAGDLSAIDPTLLITGNVAFVRNQSEAYGALMQRIVDPASWPTNFHCTGGKDRAGWAAAVVLFALGVPEDTVVEDYLLTNDYLAESNESSLEQVRMAVAAVRGVDVAEITDADIEPIKALLDVRPEYIQAALDTVVADFGDMATYLTEGLGLTPEQLQSFRDQMLE